VEKRDNFSEAEALFKVLFRFDNCKSGRPEYPEEITWQLITEYINGPLMSTSEILYNITKEAS